MHVTGQFEQLGSAALRPLPGEVVCQAQVGRVGRGPARARRRQRHALDLQVLRQQQLQLGEGGGELIKSYTPLLGVEYKLYRSKTSVHQCW